MISETLSGAPRARTISISRSAASSGGPSGQLVDQLDVADQPGQAVAGEKELIARPRVAAHRLDLELLAARRRRA